jgi:hypothetical protein
MVDIYSDGLKQSKFSLVLNGSDDTVGTILNNENLSADAVNQLEVLHVFNSNFNW